MANGSRAPTAVHPVGARAACDERTGTEHASGWVMTARRHTGTGVIKPSSIQVIEGSTRPPKRELNQLWAQLRGRPWRWIAVVPADRDLSAVPFASEVRDAWNWLSEFAVQLRVAENVDFAATAALLHRLRHDDGSRPSADSSLTPVVQTLVAVESPLKNPLVLPIIHGADGVILCAARGSTRVAAARKTVEVVGRERILS